ncbi:hypothetical protein SUGI_0021880 [Cryptomeria japonica]|nr:hypothetical protein SUGI_0021880 [Cryptomeria japonica]
MKMMLIIAFVFLLSMSIAECGRRDGGRMLAAYKGRSVQAMVVDECDSFAGCDEDHDYQPPCPNNIVDASLVVWKALGVDDIGEMSITWSDV